MGLMALTTISTRLMTPPAMLLILLSLLALNGCTSGGGGATLVATDDDATTVEGMVVWIDVLDNDVGPDIYIADAEWPLHGTIAILPEGKGISYQPDTGFIGTDSFTYSIDSPSAEAVSATVSISVIAANTEGLAAANDGATTFMNAPVLIDVLANDSGIDNQITSVSVPTSGTATIEAMGINYKPITGFTGTDTFTYEVRDHKGAVAKASVTVFIRDKYNDPVAVDDPATVRESAPEPIQINVLSNDYDLDGDPLSIVAVAQPANGNTSGVSTSIISYLPAPGFSGADDFFYMISDGLGGTAVASVNLTVTPNTPPVAVNDAFTAVQGLSVTHDVVFNDSDADGDNLRITGVTQPFHGVVTIASSTTVSYTSDIDFAGTDPFTYTISDGYGGTSTAFVTVSVLTKPNTPPIANDDRATTLVNTPVTIDVLANDTDADGDNLSVIAVDPLLYDDTATIVPGGIEYTVTSGFVGRRVFGYTVSDGRGGTDYATVDLAIRDGSVNILPVVVDDFATTTKDTPVQIDVLANDYDVDGDTLLPFTTSEPAHGTVTGGHSSELFLYTPNPGFSGTDTFTYSVSDGQVTGTPSPATVTITVTNTPPITVNDTASTVEDTPLTIDVLANDTDADGDNLSVIAVDSPTTQGGTTTIVAGEIVYQPASGYIGEDTFIYVVSDFDGGTDKATVTITVTAAPNTPPVAVNDTASTVEDTPLTIDVLANDTDADGDNLSVIAVDSPTAQGGTAAIVTGGIEYTPTGSYVGDDTFTYTVSDGHGGTDTATVTVTVDPASLAPVIRVSVDSFGNQALGSNFFLTGSPVISANGRYVAFRSAADNLVAGDSYGYQDIFLHDIGTGTTTRVSVDYAGNEFVGDSRDPAINADGRYVAFRVLTEIFLHDTQAGTSTQVSVDSAGNSSNGDNFYPDISADGTKIVFYSNATNLVSSDTNGVIDIFLHDTGSGTTTRISMGHDGSEADGNSIYPAISADGKFVAFESDATNLVTGDTNGKTDIFLYETATGITTRVSVDSSGNQGTNPSRKPTISADGQFVAFESSANNLVSGDTNVAYDIFVRDTVGDTTTRVSVASDGTQSTDYENSNSPAISDDGRYVTFYSNATNLVTGDSNMVSDIFRHDRQTGDTTRVSVDAAGTQANGASVFPEISADGRYVVYYSAAGNLVSGDTNGVDDAFRVDVTALP